MLCFNLYEMNRFVDLAVTDTSHVESKRAIWYVECHWYMHLIFTWCIIQEKQEPTVGTKFIHPSCSSNLKCIDRSQKHIFSYSLAFMVPCDMIILVNNGKQITPCDDEFLGNKTQIPANLCSRSSTILVSHVTAESQVCAAKTSL